MFSLIDFGERAGSGLNEVCTVWEKVYHTPAILEETHKNGVDRTTLTLSTGGNEQDVKAMLELYGADSIDYVEETATNRPESDQKSDQIFQNRPESDQKTDQTDINRIKSDQKSDQKNQIIEILRKNPTITRSNLANELGLHESSVKRRLEALMKEHRLKRVGPDNGGHWEIIKP